MGLIAVLAAAAAACFGAALAGVPAADGTLVAYALCLVPGTAAAVRWPRRPPLRLPSWRVTLAGRVVELAPLALGAGGVMIVLAVARTSPSAAVVLTLLLMGVVPLSALWPRPGPLGASVVLSSAGLLSPNASLADRPAVVTGFVAAAAVALVARGRLSSDQLIRLGTPPPRRERQVLGAAAGLFALALVAGLLASQIVPPRPPSFPQLGGRRAPTGGPKGKGSVAFQDQVDVSQPQGQARGGRAVVLRVRSSEPSVWRTQTFDVWDGRRWMQSEALAEEVPVEEGGSTYDGERAVGLPARPLSQRFRVEARLLDVLATAPEPVRVASPFPLRVSRLRAIRPRPALTHGAVYAVVSARSRPTAQQLQTEDATADEERFGPYLDPGPASDRVRALAAEVTAGASTSYDKARAVEGWLRSNVRAEEKAHPLPEGADVVDTALFVDRSATPAQLATAMIVLLRTAGVPARYAVGFLPGRRGLLGGDYVVRADDAYAWVEVGFARAGWVRFDPSALGERAERADSVGARLLRLLRRLASLLLVVALVGIGLVVRRWLARRRRLAALPWVSRFWPRLTKAGAAGGRPRLSFETASEYTAALAGRTLPDERLPEVGAHVTAAAFSGRELPPDARSWAEGVLGEAVAAGRAARRRERRQEWRRRLRRQAAG